LALAPPTQAGFLNFVRVTMGIPVANLPDTSPVIAMAFLVAIDLVNQALNLAIPDIYTLAVYNLAGDNLVNYAQDASNAPIYQNGMTYFTYLRTQFGCNNFSPGVVSSSADVSTSNSLQVIEAAKNLTLGNLQNLKTPWGRTYLAFAQDYGPNIWGIS